MATQTKKPISIKPPNNQTFNVIFVSLVVLGLTFNLNYLFTLVKSQVSQTCMVVNTSQTSSKQVIVHSSCWIVKPKLILLHYARDARC